MIFRHTFYFLLALTILVACSKGKPTENNNTATNNDSTQQSNSGETADTPNPNNDISGGDESPLGKSSVVFLSKDSIEISGEYYKAAQGAPIILLCHQARYNKSEYYEIAPKLNELGFNCLAIDQRSGGDKPKDENLTHQKAKEAGKGTEYQDAKVDIDAAIAYIQSTYQQKVILWGSSYSSTLALHIAAENENVSAVLSFSPGNYLDKYFGNLKSKLKKMNKPAFITSSKAEAKDVSTLIKKLPKTELQTQFIPASSGTHGARALWETDPNNEEYWTALSTFLENLKKASL